MKYFYSGLLILCCLATQAQHKIENIVVITTDGFRWQEVFNGMDTALANNSAYNEGVGKSIYEKYWADDDISRRKKLLPFLWSTIEQNGQIYGNRKYENFVNVSNPYWFSYPGYSEIFCGFVDTLINSNGYKNNPNTNVLAFLNKQQGLKNKVAAFGAWEAFDRILNEPASGFPVISAFDSVGGKHPTDRQTLINKMRTDSYKIFGMEECADVYTHYGAIETFKKDKPRILYIAYGATDEFAHEGKYNSYLDAAHQFDQWLSDIWNYLQSRPRYKNKTALFVTVDHGRGDVVKSEWRDHGSQVVGSDQIWFAVMAPGLPAKGEVKEKMQLYQKQFAQTFAALLGFTFKAEHPVADKISVLFEK